MPGQDTSDRRQQLAADTWLIALYLLRDHARNGVTIHSLRRGIMNAATVSAIAGAVGVAAGALISSVGVLLRERLVNRRERDAQQELRKQALKDQRDAFQRETILNLQDAIGQLWSLSADAYNQAARKRATSGEWPRTVITDLPDLNKVSQRVKALGARVFDEELRELTAQVTRKVWTGIEVSDWSQQPEHMEAAREPLNQLHEQAHRLLKSLYPDPAA